MQKRTVLKVLLYTFFGVACLILAFLSFIFSSFSIRLPYLNLYAQNLSWFVPLALFILVGLRLFSSLMWVSLSLVALVISGLAGVVIYEHHLDSLRVRERGIRLRDFEPFQNRAELARLEEPSTFHMQGPLLRLDGATALYPLYAAFVEATYPQGSYNPHRYDVPINDESYVVSTQTHRAYERLIEGKTDLIFVAAPSQAQQEAAQRAGVTLVLTPIGREAFIFFTHESNPVDSLTLEEIRGIYFGEITNWSSVGGLDQTITAFQRPEGSGSQTALQSLMGDTALMSPPREWVVGGMGGIIQDTANYRNHPHALGYSFRYYAMQLVNQEGLKYLQLHGVAPSVETIRDGTYPVASAFYAVHVEGNTNANLEPFLMWMQSSQGQWLVEQTGYVSLD